MEAPLELAVHGAGGRMGRRVVALATADEAFRVVSAIDDIDSHLIGRDAGDLAGAGNLDVPLSGGWPERVDVVIDFSLPTAIDELLTQCQSRRFPVVIATTGLSDMQVAAVDAAAAAIPIVFAPSMSLAVNLSMKVSQQIAEKLSGVSGGVDIEILERHHRYKADAPSGTALKFGELIDRVMSRPMRHVHGREGHTGQRDRDEIGYHAIRVGDNPGEHTVVFGMLGERIELNVAASNRDCYAAGALAAARFLHGRGPGLYNMFDVLGLED